MVSHKKNNEQQREKGNGGLTKDWPSSPRTWQGSTLRECLGAHRHDFPRSRSPRCLKERGHENAKTHKDEKMKKGCTAKTQSTL